MDILATISMVAKSCAPISAQICSRACGLYLGEPACIRFGDVPVVYPISIFKSAKHDACEPEKTDLADLLGATILHRNNPVGRAPRKVCRYLKALRYVFDGQAMTTALEERAYSHPTTNVD